MPILTPPPLKRLLVSSRSTASSINSPQTRLTAQPENRSSPLPLIQNGVLFVRDNFSARYEVFERICRDVHTIIIEDLIGKEREHGKTLLWILNAASCASTIKKLIVRNSPSIFFYPFIALSYRLPRLEHLQLHDIQFNLPANLVLPYIDYAFSSLSSLSLGISMASSYQFPIDLITGASLSHKLGMLAACTTPAVVFSNLRALEIIDCHWISSKLLSSVADCFPLLRKLRFSRCSTPQAESLTGTQDARNMGISSLSILKLDILELSLPFYRLEDLHALETLPSLELTLNGDACVSDAGHTTVAELLSVPLTHGHELDGDDCVVRARETLKRLEGKHKLTLSSG